MKIKVYFKCIQCASDNYWTTEDKIKTCTCLICGVENPYKILERVK